MGRMDSDGQDGPRWTGWTQMDRMDPDEEDGLRWGGQTQMGKMIQMGRMSPDGADGPTWAGWTQMGRMDPAGPAVTQPGPRPWLCLCQVQYELTVQTLLFCS